MNTTQKVLLIYHINPFVKDSGVNLRFWQIFNHFKSLGFLIDLYILNIENHKIEPIETDGLNNIYYLENKNKVEVILSKIQLKLQSKLNYVTLLQKRKLKNILTTNTYSHSLIFYMHWAELVNVIKRNSQNKVEILCDNIDCVALQEYYKSRKKKALGKYFTKEIIAYEMFSKVIYISYDEYVIFNTFCSRTNCYYLPQSINSNYKTEDKFDQYDIIFVGSNNKHNIDGIKWFFNTVYHLLSKEIKILIVGNVTTIISDYPNVIKIKFIEDLSVIYNKCRIAICPMFTGTGTKIKVVEALSYGLPVVCTTKGVDGFKNKENNGCIISDSPEIFAANINRLITDDAYYKRTKEIGQSFFTNNFESQYVSKLFNKIINA